MATSVGRTVSREWYGLWIVKEETWVQVQTERCMLNRGFFFWGGGGRIPALINNTLPRRAYCTCRLSLYRRDKLDDGNAAVQEGICPPAWVGTCAFSHALIPSTARGCRMLYQTRIREK